MIFCRKSSWKSLLEYLLSLSSNASWIVISCFQVDIPDQRSGRTFRLPQCPLAAAAATEAVLQTDDGRVAGRDLSRSAADDRRSGAQNQVKAVLQQTVHEEADSLSIADAQMNKHLLTVNNIKDKNSLADYNIDLMVF